MKPYGLNRIETGDDDASGCSQHGRATGVYAVSGIGGDKRAYKSLRGGRKAATRRTFKRRERANGKRDIRNSDR